LSSKPPMAPWPFNVVDLFAYLGQGFLVIFTLYVLANTYAFISITPALGTAIQLMEIRSVSVPLLIILSYTIGHLMAHLSFLFYEKIIVERYLGSPASHAFSNTISPFSKKKVIFALLLVPDYYRSFTVDFRRRLNESKPYSIGTDTTPIPTHYEVRACYSIVLENCPAIAERLTTFLNLYSFSRNASFTFAFLSIFVFVVGGKSEMLLGNGMILAAIFLFGRYLRFFRLYHDEVYLGYDAYVSKSKGDEDETSG